jgi:hypothetical protein
MHFFAVILFLSLGVLGLSMVGERATRKDSARSGRADIEGVFARQVQTKITVRCRLAPCRGWVKSINR